MNRLDKMCYTEFADYLRGEGIEFLCVEGFDFEKWGEGYFYVTTNVENVKIRYFSEDGGHQLI